MSRSYRKPFYKDKGVFSSIYWKRIRRGVKRWIKEGKDPNEIPHRRTVINDYDYCDYYIDFRNWECEETLKKKSRK